MAARSIPSTECHIWCTYCPGRNRNLPVVDVLNDVDCAGKGIWAMPIQSIKSICKVTAKLSQKTSWRNHTSGYIKEAEKKPFYSRGATFSSFRGGAIFMKFHSMTSSCLFNRGTTFSQTVTYNNNVFLPADTKYIVQTHTLHTTLDNKKHKTERLQ